MKQILPHAIDMTEVARGHGAVGFAFAIERNEHYGVQCMAERRTRAEAWSQVWTSDYVPHTEFTSYEALRAYIEGTELQDKHAPALIAVDNTSPENAISRYPSCARCGAQGAQYYVRSRIGWRRYDVAGVPACAQCLEATVADPVGAITARIDRICSNRSAEAVAG